MKIKKEQSPLRDRVRAALRKVDSRSTEWRAVKERCKHPTKKKWFICELGKEDTPFLAVDHIEPVGSLDKDLRNLTEWAQRLFVSPDKRQGLCPECHSPKTKLDNLKTRKKVNNERI